MFGHRILEWIERFGYYAVALGVLLESAGVPVPGETALMTAAFAAAGGVLQLPLIIAVAAAASILGDNAGYLLGRRLDRGWLERHGRRMLLTPARLQRMDWYFACYGPAAVALARFATGVRLVAPLLAGVARMPWKVFVRFNALGAVSWAAVMGGLGCGAGGGWGVLASPVARLAVAIFGGMVAMVLVGIALRRGARRPRGGDEGGMGGCSRG